MTVNALDGFQGRALMGKQVMTDPREMLGDNVKSGAGHQAMNIRNTAGHGVLDRNHGVLRLSAMNRPQRVLEGCSRQGGDVRVVLFAGEMGVGAWPSLEGDHSGRSKGIKSKGPGCKHLPRPVKVGGSIHTQWHRVNQNGIDPHACLKRSKLFKTFLFFERTGGVA